MKRSVITELATFAMFVWVGAISESQAESVTYLESGSYEHVGSAIYENAPDANSGRETLMRVGRGIHGPIGGSAATTGMMRGVLAFSLTGIPEGATINSVELKMTVISSEGGTPAVNLHQIILSETMAEGTGIWPSPPASLNDGVSWNELSPGVPWLTPGGDFQSAILSSGTVTASSGAMDFPSTADFVLAAQAALDNASVLQLLLRSPSAESGSSQSFRRFALDDFATESLRPQLTIYYTAATPNAPPTADAGPDQTVDCTGPLTEVSLAGTASTDPESDPLQYEWSAPPGVFVGDDRFSPTPTGHFPIGPTLVTLTVTDGNGGVATDNVKITVQDEQPPVAVCVTDIVSLWPPDHRMVEVAINVQASDACVSPENLLVSCTISSSEPDDGVGDGSSIGDVDGFDGHTGLVTVDLAYNEQTGRYLGSVALRAEREGTQAGRTYSIVTQVIDSSLNAATASCVVVVPHDKRKK